MSAMDPGRGALAAALRGGRELFSTFVKTNAYQVTEILGSCAFDFLALDAEHAPLGIESLDRCCLAARAAGTAVLVRVPNTRPDTIMRVLDIGAAGIIAPHVDDAASARGIVAATRYRGHEGRRGFSNSPRAGGYGRASLRDHIDASDAETLVVAQIESRLAVENIDEIAGTPGIDCLFIGRADLAVSCGRTETDHPEIEQAVRTVADAARRHSVPAGIFLNGASGLDRFRALGLKVFIMGSDQSHLIQACTALLRQCRGA